MRLNEPVRHNGKGIATEGLTREV